MSFDIVGGPLTFKTQGPMEVFIQRLTPSDAPCEPTVLEELSCAPDKKSRLTAL